MPTKYFELPSSGVTYGRYEQITEGEAARHYEICDDLVECSHFKHWGWTAVKWIPCCDWQFSGDRNLISTFEGFRKTHTRF